jgi:transposase
VGDGPAGRTLIGSLERPPKKIPMIMDQAYEGNETVQLVLDLGFDPVVPPRPHRLEPWQLDWEIYKGRNAIERLFRRIKAYRRVFSRFDKLDVVFIAFVQFVLIFDALRSVNAP